MNYIDISGSNCRNCYKCLRSCPVKAIKFQNEKAEIVEERCISCGNCLVICPQNAKKDVQDINKIKKAISSGKKVVASISSVFPGFFSIDEGKVISALRSLGFSNIEETALGGEIVSELYKNYIEKTKLNNYISSTCPSVVSLIEKYFPDLIKYLMPISSSMTAHGKMLKNLYGQNSFVVFIGPCIAKKTESDIYKKDKAIDAVINFDELKNWIKISNIDIKNLPLGDFDKNTYKKIRTFAMKNGIIDSIKDTLCNKNLNSIAVTGVKDCIEALKSMEKGYIKNTFLEISSCEGSCIGGPNMCKSKSLYYYRLNKVKNYIQNRNKNTLTKLPTIPSSIDFSVKFHDKSFKKKKAPKEELLKIMKSLGKYSKKDELNCGVCGYNTCLEKAQAIYEGMAETNMCLHYMRNKAENLTNAIFENTVNSIFLLDENMHVKAMNPAAEKTFLVKAKDIKDKPISLLINDEDFIYVKETQKNIIGKKLSYPQYNVVFIKTIVYMPKQRMIMVSMFNVTEEEKNKKELLKVKEETIDAAHKVIEKQMRVAQEIASLLGETTAETKTTLTKLKKVVEGDKKI
ncbi:[Fe-Fe] hydrogenase large subunit C-terminal domain-containing protein [Clostridium oceanicum]|uniref:[Fe-Fe] hydrogenase large subunit C-terminal domain-containing protein n=1 Tax=Clostridium oceanicum TaxID=1543 RepID=A0ABP3UXN6_9CLOT